jgi:hypothetical protein
VRALTPIRETVEKRACLPDLRHIFLCHAWDDRQGVAKELYDLLVARNISVWFSENDIGLGEPFLRAIDKGLAKSRIGIVLVTPALLKRLPAAGVADKELSVLLARDQLVPIVHNTTYEALREVSPMLASRNGLDTAEMPMADVAAKHDPYPHKSAAWARSRRCRPFVGKVMELRLSKRAAIQSDCFKRGSKPARRWHRAWPQAPDRAPRER